MIGQRYKLLDELGSGGMGTVYRAQDRLTRQIVALKQVHAGSDKLDIASDQLRLHLAEEFRVLAALHHPHVIQVLDYGFDALQRPFYTMELLENAETILDAGEKVPFSEKIDFLMQLLQALAYLHHRNVVHCDLKPSNVLVVARGIKVLDFGLSVFGGQLNDNASTTAGTLAYMAPEVLAGAPSTIVADIYAVGVIAFELLVGRHPFNRHDLSRLLHQVLYSPPDLSDVQLDPGMMLFLEQMLAKDPNIRFQDANEAMAALAEAAHRPLPIETIEIRESFLQTAPLVGRNYELETLLNAVNSTNRGQGSAWLVAGESGVGKSRLLEEVRIRAMVHGALVIRARSDNQYTGPYSLWRPFFRWLCLLTEVQEDEAPVLRSVMPEIADLVGDGQIQEEQATRAKLEQVIERLLARIQHPVVIILEDLHWVGSESLNLLHWISQLTTKLPLLIVGSYRDDEVADLPASLPHTQLLKLHRLSEAHIAELTEAILGEAGRKTDVVDFLHRETEGNVFFLLEIVRTLAEEAGQLDQIGSITLPHQVYAGGVKQVIQRRLARLGAASRPLLTYAALAGRQLDLQLLKALAPETDIEFWLTECANAAVLEFQDGIWKFTHDKIRDGITAELTETQLHTLHHQLATTMEILYGEIAEKAGALAFQWRMAGDHEREYPYAVRAGQLALRSGAYQEAQRYFARALDILGDETAVLERVFLNNQLAEVALGLGNYEQAQRLYLENVGRLDETENPHALAEIFNRLGDIDYALETFESASEYYERSLALFRTIGDQNGIAETLNRLGNVAYDMGDDARATQLYQESLALSRAIGVRWGMAGSTGLDGSSEF